jgi:hypothetical protein
MTNLPSLPPQQQLLSARARGRGSGGSSSGRGRSGRAVIPGVSHHVQSTLSPHSPRQTSGALPSEHSRGHCAPFRTYIRHPIPVLPVRAYTAQNQADAHDDTTHNRRVGPPVRGLCVPASGGRPDVLGVAVHMPVLAAHQRPQSGGHIRNLPPSTPLYLRGPHLDGAMCRTGVNELSKVLANGYAATVLRTPTPLALRASSEVLGKRSELFWLRALPFVSMSRVIEIFGARTHPRHHRSRPISHPFIPRCV